MLSGKQKSVTLQSTESKIFSSLAIIIERYDLDAHLPVYRLLVRLQRSVFYLLSFLVLDPIDFEAVSCLVRHALFHFPSLFLIALGDTCRLVPKAFNQDHEMCVKFCIFLILMLDLVLSSCSRVSI